jgi:hypothetical protein
METNSSSKMRRLGIILLACFVGAPLAAAPLAASGQISFRPLTINKSVRVVKAFGADDEDCVYEMRRVPRPNGTLHYKKKLICDE